MFLKDLEYSTYAKGLDSVYSRAIGTGDGMGGNFPAIISNSPLKL